MWPAHSDRYSTPRPRPASPSLRYGTSRRRCSPRPASSKIAPTSPPRATRAGGGEQVAVEGPLQEEADGEEDGDDAHPRRPARADALLEVEGGRAGSRRRRRPRASGNRPRQRRERARRHLGAEPRRRGLDGTRVGGRRRGERSLCGSGHTHGSRRLRRSGGRGRRPAALERPHAVEEPTHLLLEHRDALVGRGLWTSSPGGAVGRDGDDDGGDGEHHVEEKAAEREHVAVEPTPDPRLGHTDAHEEPAMNVKTLGEKLSALLGLGRAPVAITFSPAAPAGVARVVAAGSGRMRVLEARRRGPGVLHRGRRSLQLPDRLLHPRRGAARRARRRAPASGGHHGRAPVHPHGGGPRDAAADGALRRRGVRARSPRRPSIPTWSSCAATRARSCWWPRPRARRASGTTAPRWAGPPAR